MNSEDHHKALLAELELKGLSEDTDPVALWPVFRDYSRKVIDLDGVIVGFEYAHYDFSGVKKLHLYLVIQFEVYEDGEYDHMNQIQCHFTSDPVDFMEGKRTNLDSDDFSSAGDYFGAVESDEHFLSMGNVSNWDFECIHTGV